MKKYSTLTVILVLTGCLLAGCGCTRRGAQMDTMPATEMTILPTNIPETTAPILPSTEAPTLPVTEPTVEVPSAATDDGILDATTEETSDAGARSRIR